MKTSALVLAVLGAALALMLPAITAARVAAERNLQSGGQRLSEVAGHLDDSPHMAELGASMAANQAAGAAAIATTNRQWWLMCVASALCFGGAGVLFFWPAPKKPLPRRRGPPPEFSQG